MKKTLIALIILITFYSGVVSAHQPRLVEEVETIDIQNPTISQAYYATLSGKNDRYTVSSDSEFLLLTEVLTPVITGKEPGTFVFMVTTADTGETLLVGTTSKDNEIFYEPFAGDEYRQGPRFEEMVPAGTYEFEVKGEEGEKYVIVVGKRELFPFDEIINTYKTLPSLKMDYFEKPFYTIFTNPTGAVLLILTIILLVILFLLYRFLRKRKNRSVKS